MTEMNGETEAVPQKEKQPDPASRVKRSLRERVARHVVTPDRVSRALVDAFDRVAHELPEMDRARGIFEKTSKVVGMTAVAADIAVAAFSAYVSAGKGARLLKYRRTNSLEALTESLGKHPVTTEAVHIPALKLPTGTPPEEVARQRWQRDQRSKLAGIAGFGGAAGAILASQPVARTSELAAHVAGSLGERVARRMQEIRSGQK